MSYNDIADMASDGNLQRRVMACAWQEHATSDPGLWAIENNWLVASQPGWTEAWTSARLGKNPNPGNDESVITDSMILSAVQSLISST